MVDAPFHFFFFFWRVGFEQREQEAERLTKEVGSLRKEASLAKAELEARGEALRQVKSRQLLSMYYRYVYMVHNTRYTEGWRERESERGGLGGAQQWDWASYICSAWYKPSALLRSSARSMAATRGFRHQEIFFFLQFHRCICLPPTSTYCCRVD